jgi:hypothetical protein
MAPKPIKKTTTPKKAYNFWDDPTFQSVYGSQMEQGLGQRNAEQNRLMNLRTDIYGERGQLAQNREESIDAQNRLAEEMAMKGRLSGGAYAGPQKGRGTLLQSTYQQKGRNIENQFTSQANPMNLMEQGLKMNPDGSISPLAPGEEISDPATGKKIKYDWANTNSGMNATNQARSAALLQMLSKITKV